MNKFDDKLNLLKDIAVFEYVSGEQSPAAKANFEKTLSDNQGLQNEVNIEKELRNLVKQSQEPSVVASDNINSLFDRIDAEPVDDISSVNNTSNVTPLVSFSRPMAGLAMAACLLVAVFISINVNNDLLEPKFQTLSSPTLGDAIDLNALANEGRLIKFELASPLSQDSIDSLMSKYELQNLSQSVNERIITVKTENAVNEKTLLTLKLDKRIKDVELIKFN